MQTLIVAFAYCLSC